MKLKLETTFMTIWICNKTERMIKMYMKEEIRHIPPKELLVRLKEEYPDLYQTTYGLIPCFVDGVLVMFHRFCDYSDSSIPNIYWSHR